MALPKIATATYTMTIPSSKQVVKYRPFLVREQKALLLAQQSEDHTVMIDTLKSVIETCVLTTIDVDKLAVFDIEYIFLQIRAKSVGEIVDLMFACDSCGTQSQLSFDLTKAAVEFNKNHTNKIDLGNNVGIVMKYPSIDTLKRMEKFDVNNVADIFNVISECIDFIWEGEQVHYAKDSSPSELDDFINSLTSSQFELIKAFFETMPSLEQKVIFDCPKCKTHHDKVLKGIDSFF